MKAEGFAVALGAAMIAQLVPAGAQTTPQYYTPPKRLSAGKATTPNAAAGTVVVKVFVSKTGVAKSFTIVRSTNHGNDAASLQIARSSTYAPATRGTTKVDAFYDYTLRFTAAGVTASTADDAPGGDVGKYKLMIGSGNYSGAIAGLTSYVGSHPSDQAAYLQLGIAQQLSKDPASAAASFDKAGTIPPNDQQVALAAYDGAAGAAIKAKDYASAVAFGKKAVALAPSAGSYNALGVAQDASGDSADAVASLEQARSRAEAAKMTPTARATIEANLVSAYLAAGRMSDASAALAQAKSLDPSNDGAQMAMAEYYVGTAQKATAKQAYADAAKAYESGATTVAPKDAAAYYAQAALSYLQIKDKTPYDLAKADADKALASDPNNAQANYAQGVILADQGKGQDALPYFNKADAAAKASGNTSLSTAVEAAIKQVSATK